MVHQYRWPMSCSDLSSSHHFCALFYDLSRSVVRPSGLSGTRSVFDAHRGKVKFALKRADARTKHYEEMAVDPVRVEPTYSYWIRSARRSDSF